MHAHLRGLLVASMLAAAPLAAQTEIWVDPVLGNNSNPGTYLAPVQSLSYAVALAGFGYRINLLPGLYGPQANGEIVPITVGAQPQAGLVIRGIGDAGSVTFDMAGSVQPLFRLMNGAHGARITNLTIANTDQAGWWTRAVNSGSGVNSNDAANNVEFDRCQFVAINRGFVLWTSDNVQGWRIHDNLFRNCTNDAILEYAGNNEIYNNTFVTGTFKAYISDSPTSLCYNNLVVGYNIAFENNNSANNVARYQANWLWQCGINTTGVGFSAALPPSNRIGQDPLLVNPGANDFRPQPTSPLVEAGDPGVFQRADLDHHPRAVDFDNNGSILPDIGAYELTPILLQVGWTPATRLMTVACTSTQPNTFGFVLFSFDDGLVQIPGFGPILIDQATFVPAVLSGPLPGNWLLNFNSSRPFLPGQRLVMQALAVVGNGSVFLGSNQVWTQL